MQDLLDRDTERLKFVMEKIAKGEVHHDPDWSWDCEAIALEHDIAVYKFAIKNGQTDLNTACEALYDSVLNDDD